MSRLRIQFNFILKAQRYRCFYCARPIGLRGSPPPSRDHRVPRARGGSDAIDNIVAACKPCNAAKADTTEAEYRALIKAGPAPDFIEKAISDAVALIRSDDGAWAKEIAASRHAEGARKYARSIAREASAS